MEAIRSSLGLSQRQVEERTGIPANTFRKWVSDDRNPSRRKIGEFLAGIEPIVRQRAPELDRMLDPLRVALGREPATGADPRSMTTLEAVPPAGAAGESYGVRMTDGRTAICEESDAVPGHLHAVRWRSASGSMAGIYRVTPTGKTQVTLTQDDRPGDVLVVKVDQLDRCDPIVAVVSYLLP